MPCSPDPPVSVVREAPASTSYKRPEHPLVEPRNQTEPQGSGASTMTWEPQQRVDGGAGQTTRPMQRRPRLFTGPRARQAFGEHRKKKGPW